ncbi:hypothetical protein COT82_01035 [Candidatus Campbellbacteria bacterium CG10_big_fil_rev_8_21_14_0_10_35_52]|uniref:Radical SAM core domain-containing protein n=1 Tax=Candidatus Campbellbacteria bacterium CG10_big_fil_rev_8_21_14_0_10_35_52 TaxID=1974527 RepID=A0A2M6WVI8_9BACT|nr:MAG: hypothetical protein COT82_01035 [Candidatus Campbellbacteria bacterium CG10_big_fil_rev_8_21_14_0_10_35_52]
MKRKQSIAMVQVNYQYGSNIFVPYSVGSIQAYAETISEIKKSFQFQRPLFLRKDPVEVVKGMEEPAVVGFSCYLWNWRYNESLAKAVRNAFPDCLIVFGGAQVPNDSKNFFVEHPYVDILVHNEGELAFTEILLESLCSHPDYRKIAGLSIRVEDTRAVKTAPSVRIMDLSVLPSPYTSGIFDFLLGRSFVLNASQETTRGCPYACTYCDWGGDSYKKVVRMNEQRILDEFEWFGGNKVEYIFNCDANYGMSALDYAHTVRMLEARAKYDGYPQKFRMCTAKNSNDRIFEITKLLSDAGMNKGATLSFQSMDETTLETVKRKNIKIQKFSKLMDKYSGAGIATYTELILGMPGETYESSKRGIDTLLDAQADAVNLYVYVCTMLPNSEMNNPQYSKQNGIKSVRMPILLSHSTSVSETEEIVEYENIIVETSSMSNTDWQRTYLFYWIVQTFHCLGLTQYIAILFRKHFGAGYSDFYEKLIKYFSIDEETLIGKEVALVRGIIARSINGGRIDLALPRFGNIYWPLEEASFLSLVTDKNKFYWEIRLFIEILVADSGKIINDILLDDVVRYQSAVVRDPYTAEYTIELEYDLHGYFSSLNDGMTVSRIPSKLMIKAEKAYSGNLETFAREVVWYGRKGGSFRNTDITREVI